MNYIKILALPAAMLLIMIDLYAQETVPSTGGDVTGTGGTSSFTIGQIVYSTHTGTSGSIAQGVQHPFEIYTTVGFEVKEINLKFIAYPNPTHNILSLEIDNYNKEALIYQLYDIKGALIESNPIVNSTTTINMQQLPSNTYLINVLNNNFLIKTFRIVKN